MGQITVTVLSPTKDPIIVQERALPDGGREIIIKDDPIPGIPRALDDPRVQAKPREL